MEQQLGRGALLLHPFLPKMPWAIYEGSSAKMKGRGGMGDVTCLVKCPDLQLVIYYVLLEQSRTDPC